MKKELVPTNQQSLEGKQSIDEILESQQTDTSHCPHQSAKAKGTVHEDIDLDTNHLYEQSQSEDRQDFTEDTLVLIPDGSNDKHHSTTKDDTGECTIIKMSKPLLTLLCLMRSACQLKRQVVSSLPFIYTNIHTQNI